MKIAAKIIASFFGVGYFPVAPGTLTSFIVVLIYKLFLHKMDWPIHLLIFFFLFFIGTFTSSIFSSALKSKDPRKIVIDEAAGQYLALFQLSSSWFPLLLCFFLFRLFDIIKPFPIKKVETFPKGWGIMLDDLVAALYAGILIYVFYLFK